MRILITWGSKRGSTAGIGRSIAEALQSSGHEVTALPATSVTRVEQFGAVIVGGALYANRWARDARRFVERNEKELRRIPTWFFSSGPLDDSATRKIIPPTRQVELLMERVGALGHATFGGRLAPDAKGFPAAAMAKKRAGDWRDSVQIRTWAAEVARTLPFAKPRAPIVQPGRGLGRLVAHGVVGWALCAAAMTGLLRVASPTTAMVMHAILVLAIFAAIARHYFAVRGAREPVATALAFAGIVVVLDLVVVAGLLHNGFAMFASFVGFWLPVLLIFCVTAAIGMISGMAPIAARKPT